VKRFPSLLDIPVVREERTMNPIGLLVTVEGHRARRLVVGPEPLAVPWGPGVRARFYDGAVRLSGPGVPADGRLAPGRVVSIGGRRTSCLGARSVPEGLEVFLGPSLVGASEALVRAFHLAACSATTSDPVLVLGESGTGKDLLARAVHDLGCADRPFVALNLAAIPRDLAEAELFGWTRGAFTGASAPRAGAFESASDGTLFLDEVAEAPLSVQAKLLRAVEDGAVTRLGTNRPVTHRARVVAATHQDPAMAVSRGTLRLDLLQRLACFVIRIPPLRERPEDLPAIVRRLCRGATAREGITPSVVEVLSCYSWPGNVRELRNVVRRAEALSGDGLLRPDAVREAISVGRLALAPVNGVADGGTARPDRRRQIAESGLPRSTFYYRLKRGWLPGGPPGEADVEAPWPAPRVTGGAG
jgi:DNA-binding NtrC family response regulator